MTQGSWQTSGPVMLLILLWQASWFSSISLPVPMKLSTGFSSLSLAVILGPDMRCKLTLLDKDHATDPSKTFATYKSWSPNQSRYASPTSQKFFHSFQGDPTDLSSAFSSSWRALCTCVCVCFCFCVRTSNQFFLIWHWNFIHTVHIVISITYQWCEKSWQYKM